MSKVIDSVLGLAIGDAMGVPIETYKREYLKLNPVINMIGHLSHNLPKGYWSDDTSLTLATLESIADIGYISYEDIMKKFQEWLFNGKYTPSGITFGVGNTCMQAIEKYNGNNATQCGINNINNNGNGSIMRILPCALYAYYTNCNNNTIFEICKNLSSLTHRHEISIIGCYIMTNYLLFLLKGFDKFESYYNIKHIDYSMFNKEYLKLYNRILRGSIAKLKEEEISSLWYVIDTLESALYSVLTTESFKDAIIKAINLGGDTDTVGAVTGSIVGIIYGYKNIPKEWLNDLYNKNYIENICIKFERKLKIK